MGANYALSLKSVASMSRSVVSGSWPIVPPRRGANRAFRKGADPIPLLTAVHIVRAAS